MAREVQERASPRTGLLAQCFEVSQHNCEHSWFLFFWFNGRAGRYLAREGKEYGNGFTPLGTDEKPAGLLYGWAEGIGVSSVRVIWLSDGFFMNGMN